jgi:hypothetical protein
MIHRNSGCLVAAASAIGLSAAVFFGAVGSPQPARANDWAAPFIGGLIGGHVLTNFSRERREQTQAMQEMARDRQPAYAPAYREPAYSAPARAPAPAPAPAQTSATSIENKLNVLDQLAAKGYITKEQYQARRKAILDSL